MLDQIKYKQELHMTIVGRTFETRKSENGIIIGYTLVENIKCLENCLDKSKMKSYV